MLSPQQASLHGARKFTETVRSGQPRDKEPSGATSFYKKRQVCLWAPLANPCLTNQPQDVSADLTSVLFTRACLGRTPGTLPDIYIFRNKTDQQQAKAVSASNFRNPTLTSQGGISDSLPVSSGSPMSEPQALPLLLPAVQTVLFSPEDPTAQNGSPRPESEVQLPHSQVVWPWANYWASLSSVSSSEKWAQDHASFKEMDFECSSIRGSTSWVLTVSGPPGTEGKRPCW